MESKSFFDTRYKEISSAYDYIIRMNEKKWARRYFVLYATLAVFIISVVIILT